uniref:uncharacterized protein LOC122610975 n=1 Tax=Erigeron canadensis TaxID=72917 RepID=UPI001CB8F6A9|nr:uncharacterized protein LOC122610975 [Erigeron canadensis]
MVESESDPKSHLIKHISDISNHAKSSCPHRCTFDSNSFIDWYILLQVDDNVGVDIIRKKYHKYALLLHPDKNNHPKAEFAFKLVSEAYGCLSDESRRLEFDAKRWNNTCNECTKTPTKTRTKPKGSTSSPLDRSKSKKISSRVKEVKAKFREEARVIEKCLKANANIGVFNKEMPVFDPKDYGTTRENPHSRVFRCNDDTNSSSKWLKKRFNFDNQVRCESPVFEFKPNRSSYNKLKPIPMPI